MNDTIPYMLENLAQGAGSKLDPVLLASEARKELGLEADEPILDICSLLEQAGVKLFPYNYASDEFFGLSVGPKDNGPAIIVNTWERISTERKIFSAAHELGHLLMHISGYSIDNISEDRQQEAEADLFTGYFLMPKKGFDKEWDAAAGLHFPDRVMKVKYIFKVSYKTVLYRLIHLGVADKTIWKKFNLAFEQYYEKKLSHKEEPFSEGAEPYGIQRFNFHEERLSRLTREAIETEAISLSRGAEILRISTDAMMSRISELETII